jgi:uroporphyrinogen-III synthase
MNAKKIILTRPVGAQTALIKRLEAEGAQVVELPLISVRIEAPAEALTDVFSELTCYQWIVFTSAHGVEAFFHYFFKAFEDIRCLGPMSIACVGEGTAQALRKLHLAVDLMPEKATAVDLAKKLVDEGNIQNAAVLVVQGNRNSPELVDILGNAGGAIVDVLPAYVTQELDWKNDPHAQEVLKTGADVICFASPSAVEAFLKVSFDKKARMPLLCSIGLTTSEFMRQHKLPIHAEAANPTTEAVALAIKGLLA